MSDSPRSGSPVEGSILVSDTDESGQTIETRRRLSSLVNKETARAFGEVSKALGLNLSELVVEVRFLHVFICLEVYFVFFIESKRKETYCYEF